MDPVAIAQLVSPFIRAGVGVGAGALSNKLAADAIDKERNIKVNVIKKVGKECTGCLRPTTRVEEPAILNYCTDVECSKKRMTDPEKLITISNMMMAISGTIGLQYVSMADAINIIVAADKFLSGLTFTKILDLRKTNANLTTLLVIHALMLDPALSLIEPGDYEANLLINEKGERLLTVVSIVADIQKKYEVTDDIYKLRLVRERNHTKELFDTPFVMMKSLTTYLTYTEYLHCLILTDDAWDISNGGKLEVQRQKGLQGVPGNRLSLITKTTTVLKSKLAERQAIDKAFYTKLKTLDTIQLYTPSWFKSELSKYDTTPCHPCFTTMVRALVNSSDSEVLPPKCHSCWQKAKILNIDKPKIVNVLMQLYINDPVSLNRAQAEGAHQTIESLIDHQITKGQEITIAGIYNIFMTFLIKSGLVRRANIAIVGDYTMLISQPINSMRLVKSDEILLPALEAVDVTQAISGIAQTCENVKDNGLVKELLTKNFEGYCYKLMFDIDMPSPVKSCKIASVVNLIHNEKVIIDNISNFAVLHLSRKPLSYRRLFSHMEEVFVSNKDVFDIYINVGGTISRHFLPIC